MKGLLVMAAVGLVSGCAVKTDGPGGEAKFENPFPYKGKQVRGKYYTMSHKVYYVDVEGMSSKKTDLEIYHEIDFGEDGRPVVNVKNSERPNHCDQIPAEKFSYESEYKEYESAGEDELWLHEKWTASWVNNDGHEFEVEVYVLNDESVSIKCVITVESRGLKLTYNSSTTEGTTNESTWLGTEAAKNFGPGDNCGESESGDDKGSPTPTP